MILNILFWLGGLVVSGVKVFTQVERWKQWSRDCWGLQDKRILYVLENLLDNPKRAAHHLTDYIVEWNRLDAQRGAKTFSGIIICLLLLLLLS